MTDAPFFYLLPEGGLDGSPTARVIPIPHFIFKGSLVDPRLRASNKSLSFYFHRGSGQG